MANRVLTPQQIRAQMLAALKNNIKASWGVDVGNKIGDTIEINRPPRFASHVPRQLTALEYGAIALLREAAISYQLRRQALREA
jgi:hypothetical protein